LFLLAAAFAALAGANLMTHLDGLGVAPGWQRRGALVGLDVVVLMMVIITGRIVPDPVSAHGANCGSRVTAS
jgi:uncharacterized protein involved in response to NO